MVSPAVSDAATLIYPRRLHGSAASATSGWAAWCAPSGAAVNTMDERSLDRVQRRMFARDELGAQTVMVIRRPNGPQPEKHAFLEEIDRGQ